MSSSHAISRQQDDLAASLPAPSIRISIPAAIADLLRGQPLVVLDDHEGGQVVVAGGRVRPDTIAFMARHARGLVSVAISPARAAQLQLEPQPGRSGRPFLVPLEAREGVTTGISAADRARTIAVVSDSASRPEDLIRPGHVTPILVDQAGVLAVPSAPEAAVDLAVLAGLSPTAAVCGIMNDSGSPAVGEDLESFCREHGLRAVKVADLIAYRRCRDEVVTRIVGTALPTPWGTFRAIGYRSLVDRGEHIALVCGDPAGVERVPVRIQRHCIAGEVFQAHSCGCRMHLDSAARTIQDLQLGVIVHLAAREGHGWAHGTLAPDTDSSSGPDLAHRRQENALAARIIKDLGARSVTLLCGPDERPRHLAAHGVQVDGDLRMELLEAERTAELG